MTSCPKCGARSESTAAECPSCGLPLRPFAVERRRATVLFADLCSSTSFAAGRDPEEVHAVVDRCLGVMSDIVAHYGGIVTRVAGDEVMAVFGVPVAHGDDAERAVRAALAITRAELAGLAVRVGVNSGDVFVAPLGTGAARQFTVTGQPVNLAARLREHAAQGGVLAGPETRYATRGVVEYAALPPLQLKGFDERVAAWAPHAAAPAPGRPLSGVPFTGRETERSLLRASWRAVQVSGARRLVTVLGPPGVGKSRLVAEFTGEVAADGSVVARGRCLPYGRPAPYEAVAALLRSLAGIRDETATTAARAAFDGWLAARVDDRDASHLRLLAGLADDADTTVDLQALVASMVRVIASVDRPAVLVVEDLHWSSPSQLALLEHAVARLSRIPLLVIALARPELTDRAPTWGRDLDGAVRLDLDPLPDRAACVLARALLGSRASAEGVHRLVDRAAGVPLFLEELAAEHTERPADRRALPGTVQDAVCARLDTLPPPARATAMVAAVLGTDFALPTLAALRAAPAEADLALLERRGFLRRDGSAPRFAFRHQLIRDVAYRMLPHAERRDLHARAARHLEDHDGSAEALAHHWERAGDTERTLFYLLAAAAAARRAWAKDDAIQWYEKASGLLRTDDPRRPDVEVALGLTLVERGAYPRALQVLDGVLARVAGPSRAEALLGMSRAAFWTMDTARAQQLAEAAAELAGADAGLQVRCEVQRSTALSVRETWAADGLRQEEAALGAWPSDAPHTELVGLLQGLGIGHYWVGDYPQAVRRCRDGQRLAHRIHDIDGALLNASHLGLALVGLGRHEEALAIYAEAARQGREHELVPRFTARLVSMWGGALRELGDTAGARDRAAEATELALTAGFPFTPVQSGIDVLCCDLADGRIGQARRAWPQLHEQAQAVRGWHNWLTLGRLAVARAEIALAAGDPHAAVTAAVEAEAYARRTHRRKYVVAARHVHGLALLDLGRPAAAVPVLERAVAGADALQHPPIRWRAASCLARALAAAGRDGAAERHATRARQILGGFAAGVSDEHRRTLLGSSAAVLSG